MSVTKSSQFQRIEEKGWKRGMGNLLAGELSSWFKTRRWLKQVLLWLLIINLILFFTVIGLNVAAKEAAAAGEPPPEVDTPMLYGVFGGMFVAFGAMVIMQRVIVGEKREGTAAWVLSKPVTRTAFVVSRLVGNTLGVLLTAVLVPGAVAYLTIGILTPLGWLPPLNYLAGIAVLCLSAFFWLTLTLMMGTFFEASGGVIAIPMGLYFAMWMLPSVLTPLMYITPVILTVGPEGDFKGVSTALMLGESPFSWLPVISAVIFSVLFITVAIRRFNRQEF
jgi:ABC-2 type transport system permease protein